MRARLATALVVLAVAATADPPVPAPRDHLGFEPGAEGRLAGWDALRAYYAALDRATDRVRTVALGTSVGGRELVAIAISDAENLTDAAADENRVALRAVASMRTLSGDAGRAIAARARGIALVTCGLHATECASALTAATLAHYLASGEDEVARLIRAELVVVLVPAVNPDGVDAVARWWDRAAGTPAADRAVPFLDHPYAGTDLNRDAYMLSQPESRFVDRLMIWDWPAQVAIDLHEMAPNGPRCFVPPFADPLAPELAPLLVREVDLLGEAMALALERADLPGVVQGVLFDAWWNGGLRSAAWRRNVAAVLVEVARPRYAASLELHPAQLRGFPDGLPDLVARYRYPRPWPGGTWTLADSIRYQRVATIGALELFARLRRPFLELFASLAQRSINQGLQGSPRAFALSAAPRDPGAQRRLLETLTRGGIQVRRASVPVEAAPTPVAVGDYVVDLAQAYRAQALSLLGTQRYPELRANHHSPPLQPYDIAGWSLPLQLGVDVRSLAELAGGALRESDLALTFPAEPPTRSRPAVAPCRDSDAYPFAIWHAARGRPVRVLDLAGALALGRATRVPELAAGDFVVLAPHDPAAPPCTLMPLAAASDAPLGTGFLAGDALDDLVVRHTKPLTLPRVGVYRPPFACPDEGWTRWVLDGASLPFTSIDDLAVAAGALEGLDVLVVPDITVSECIHGDPHVVEAGKGGGLGESGLARVYRFVTNGGTLVALNRSCALPCRLFDLSITDATDSAHRPPATDKRAAALDRFACPGSILAAVLDTAHTIGWGGVRDASVVFAHGPLLDAREGQVVARFADEGRLLRSGYLREGALLAGRPAVVVVERGRGRVILFGFKPQFRGQPSATIRWLLNAVLHR